MSNIQTKVKYYHAETFISFQSHTYFTSTDQRFSSGVLVA